MPFSSLTKMTSSSNTEASLRSKKTDSLHYKPAEANRLMTRFVRCFYKKSFPPFRLICADIFVLIAKQSDWTSLKVLLTPLSSFIRVFSWKYFLLITSNRSCVYWKGNNNSCSESVGFELLCILFGSIKQHCEGPRKALIAEKVFPVQTKRRTSSHIDTFDFN